MTRSLRRGFAACLGAVLLAASPAAAATAPEAPRAVAQCPLAPGVYGIIDSHGNIIGILIVYPDCTTEIYPKEDTPKEGEL